MVFTSEQNQQKHLKSFSSYTGLATDHCAMLTNNRVKVERSTQL